MYSNLLSNIVSTKCLAKPYVRDCMFSTVKVLSLCNNVQMCLLQPLHSTPSANAAVSFCQLIRLILLTQSSPSATAAVCVNSMK